MRTNATHTTHDTTRTRHRGRRGYGFLLDPRGSVLHLNLVVPDVGELGERLVEQEDGVVDEGVHELEERGGIAGGNRDRDVVVRYRPQVLEQRGNVVAVRELVVEAAASYCAQTPQREAQIP